MCHDPSFGLVTNLVGRAILHLDSAGLVDYYLTFGFMGCDMSFDLAVGLDGLNMPSRGVSAGCEQTNAHLLMPQR